MNECSKVLNEKEQHLYQFIKNSAYNFDNGLNKEYDSDNSPLNSSKFTSLFKAFGAPSRTSPIKRVRSSFHFDDNSLNAREESIQSKREETSPRSDSTWKDYDSYIKKLKIEPRYIMKQAFKKVDVHGSSTAWLAILQNKILRIANLGDSTWILIRYSFSENKSKVLLKTEEQQHNFNAPYQLSNLPENLKSGSIFGSEYSSKPRFWSDKPSDSVLYQWKVDEGDIVIWATDGLFDNLFVNEILKIVDIFMSELTSSTSITSFQSFQSYINSSSQQLKEEMMAPKNARRLAKELVKEAYKKSRSRNCFTPFGEKFDKSNITKNNELLRWKGGKPDDICAVVGFIKISESPDI